MIIEALWINAAFIPKIKLAKLSEFGLSEVCLVRKFAIHFTGPVLERVFDIGLQPLI